MLAISVDKVILFLKVTGTILPYLFLASGSFGKSLACSCLTQISASVFAWLSSLCILSSHKHVSHWIHDFISRSFLITSAKKICFQNKVTF